MMKKLVTVLKRALSESSSLPLHLGSHPPTSTQSRLLPLVPHTLPLVLHGLKPARQPKVYQSFHSGIGIGLGPEELPGIGFMGLHSRHHGVFEQPHP
jgi:hypothetical protein